MSTRASILASGTLVVGAIAGGFLLATRGFARPERIHFRLLRGPVPLVTETFELRAAEGSTATDFEYRGELATDLWAAGAWWGQLVARRWEAAVASSMASIQKEAERRAAGATGGGS